CSDPSLGDRADIHVPAWGLVALGTEHAVPVGLRWQGRGLYGPLAILDLLPALRGRGGGSAGDYEPWIDVAYGWGKRCYFWCARCLFPFASAGQHTGFILSGIYPDRRAGACSDLSRPLVCRPNRKRNLLRPE